MSNDQDKVMKAMRDRIVELEEDVNDLRHVVAALANTSGNADRIAELVDASKRQEQLQRAKDDSAAKRQRVLTWHLAWGSPRTKEATDAKLTAQGYSPLTPDEITRYKL